MKKVATVSELGLQLTSGADILTLLGACYTAEGLLLEETDLSPAFLNLKTGLLGELFQKCVNYRLPVAVVIADPAAYGVRFAELAHEHRRHAQIRFFPTSALAWAWLEDAAPETAQAE